MKRNTQGSRVGRTAHPPLTTNSARAYFTTETPDVSTDDAHSARTLLCDATFQRCVGGVGVSTSPAVYVVRCIRRPASLRRDEMTTTSSSCVDCAALPTAVIVARLARHTRVDASCAKMPRAGFAVASSAAQRREAMNDDVNHVVRASAFLGQRRLRECSAERRLCI